MSLRSRTHVSQDAGTVSLTQRPHNLNADKKTEQSGTDDKF